MWIILDFRKSTFSVAVLLLSSRESFHCGVHSIFEWGDCYVAQRISMLKALIKEAYLIIWATVHILVVYRVQWPEIHLCNYWKNIRSVCKCNSVKKVWYKVIHWKYYSKSSVVIIRHTVSLLDASLSELYIQFAVKQCANSGCIFLSFLLVSTALHFRESSLEIVRTFLFMCLQCCHNSVQCS